MKWLKAVPYGLVLLFILAQPRLAGFDANALYRSGSREAIESTGEVWRVIFRDGVVVYATAYDFALYWAPFVLVPVFIISVLWIVRDLWRAGVFR